MFKKLRTKIYTAIISLFFITTLFIAFYWKSINLITFVFLFITLSVILILFLEKIVIFPLQLILSNLAGIAKSSLPHRIRLNLKGEFALIISAFNQIILQLCGHRDLLEEKIEELKILNNITRLINSNLHLEKMINTFLDEIIKIMKVEEAIIFLKDKQDILYSAFFRGRILEEIQDIKFKIGEGIAGWSLKTGESIIVNNPEQDTRFLEIARHRKIRSLICVPIKLKEETTGVLSLANKLNGEVFLESNKIFLETLSPSLAIAIENARLYELAITDELSGLYVYRYFKNTLYCEFKRAKRYNQPLSLITFDIDNFKDINDTYGHLVGDEVIRSIARILKSIIRTSDIPCRYGGEEFTVILPQTNLEGAKQLAERIRQEIQNKKIYFDNFYIQVTASFGVSDITDKEIEEEIILAGDRALYTAKQSGKNKVVIENFAK